MDWSVDSMSCVMFAQPRPSGAVVMDTLQLWQRLFGTSPQAFNQLPGGVSQASGVAGEHQMVVTAQQGRTELTLQAAPPTATGPAGAAGIGPFSTAIADVAGALEALAIHARTFVKTEDAIRMAVLINLSRQAGDPSEAAAEFMRNTKIDAPSGSSDLTFSYNLPGKTAEGVDINRLRRWVTGAQQTFLMHMMQVNAGPVTPTVPIVQTTYATFFQIDVNTAPQLTMLPIGDTITILNALIAEAKTLISSHYDSPASNS